MTVERVENKYVTRVALGDSYDKQSDILTYVLSNGGALPPDPASGSAGGVYPTPDDINRIISSLPLYQTKQKHRDTYVGGNDAVNSYYQFCENDDIIHPVNATDDLGMGRVYNEAFDQNQQILYLSFGLPDFTNATTFMKNAYDKNLATLMNRGEVSWSTTIGNIVGDLIGLAILIPLAPIKFGWYLLTAAGSSAPTKYYDFKPAMGLYYKMVNVMIATIAANMNLTDTKGQNGQPENYSGGLSQIPGIPNLFRKHGLDILSILSRKSQYDDPNAPMLGTDELFSRSHSNSLYELSAWSSFTGGVSSALTEEMRYFGLRVEKSTSSQESASNSTKEPDFLETMNSIVRQGREVTNATSAIKNIGGAGGAVLNAVSDFFVGSATAVGSMLNLTGGVELAMGAGFVDVPEIWSASQFSKSYNFDFQFRSPYGDPISVFYSLYIPLIMLIVGAFPRSVGQNTYTSPFLVRAHCQGMFSIPMGIIDSITIKRGNTEYGWANASGAVLPTEIDVSMTIKDMSPVMHVALTDGSDQLKAWMNIFGQNSTFQEYMLTLSGTNVAQRTLLMDQFKRRKNALLSIISNNRFNPIMFGFSLGTSRVGNAISRVTPISRLPGRTSSTIPTQQ